MIIIVWI